MFIYTLRHPSISTTSFSFAALAENDQIIDQLAPFKYTLTALKTLDVIRMNQLWKVVTFCRSVRGNILVLRQRYLLRSLEDIFSWISKIFFRKLNFALMWHYVWYWKLEKEIDLVSNTQNWFFRANSYKSLILKWPWWCIKSVWGRLA